MKKTLLLLTFILLFMTGCKDKNQAVLPNNDNYQIATFAGGCFWCVESAFESVDGIGSVISGYAGGTEENPTYEQVASGQTSHREAIQVYYDPNKIDYELLVNTFWYQINPTDNEGQFADKGFQYTTAIFYHDEEQKRIAELSKQKLINSKKFEKEIVTPILPFTTFYPAEKYHQDYHLKNPIRYQLYTSGSGRKKYLEETWKRNELKNPSSKNINKPFMSDKELQEKLTPLQYKVTQKDGTEPPFENEYWDNKEDGIYVDIVSGEPLFSSTTKYESGTGWPSFYEPLVPENIVEKKDFKLFFPRTEVRSTNGNSHLGHVFNDGPDPTGLRYCLNSASLKFIPKDELEKEGYEEYINLFK